MEGHPEDLAHARFIPAETQFTWAKLLKNTTIPQPFWNLQILIVTIHLNRTITVLIDNFRVLHNGFIPHGKKVVVYIMKHEGLIAFEKMWRQHFLDNMEPKFLPDLWSVDHSHARLAVMENNLKMATKIITREKKLFGGSQEDLNNMPQPSTSSSNKS